MEGAGAPAGAVAQCPPRPAQQCSLPVGSQPLLPRRSWTRERQEPQDALGYGLVEFPQLLLLGKGPFSPWKTLI